MMRAASIIGIGINLQAGAEAAETAALSKAELSSFHSQMDARWNAPSTSARGNAQNMSVGFETNRDGKPFKSTLRPFNAGKDTRPAVREAYSAAKHAIIRCGAKGYKLPLEKFEQWKNIEITFDPERMPT